jgi:pectin methylesterase-like acyl-CoA thioesterase
MQGSLNNINLANTANPPGFIFNRADSLRQRSIGSRRSVSLSRMSSDRVLGSIRLSHELADQILADVDSSAVARIGDSGDRVMHEEEEMDGNFMAGHVSDEAFVGLEGLQPADAKSPLAEDPILSASTKVKKLSLILLF